MEFDGRLSVVTLYQQTLLGFCYQSTGIACQQALSKNPEPNADTDGYDFIVRI